MNRLIIIGNGFDLAHGLKTSYMDFINWYWDQVIETMRIASEDTYSDPLCSFRNRKESGTWFSEFFGNLKLKRLHGIDAIRYVRSNYMSYETILNEFFEKINTTVETKKWVDIEVEYYTLLKEYSEDYDKCKQLNEQLLFLQKKLVEYLSSLPDCEKLGGIVSVMGGTFMLQDIATNEKNKVFENINSNEDEYNKINGNHEIEKKWIPERVMVLSFNYTQTIEKYQFYKMSCFDDIPLLTRNYIHGSLNDQEHIIFGYGDELDNDFKRLLDKNENELLNHSKNNLYLLSDRYRKMQEFIEAAPFQVLIMGHSCGLSDRTLLNTIFEHDNCVSIKPYYYQKPDGTDNYLELVQNISRNFKDMKKYRDRVVNKRQCEPLSQLK